MRAERNKASAVVKSELATPPPRAIEQTTAHGRASELNIWRLNAAMNAVLIPSSPFSRSLALEQGTGPNIVHRLRHQSKAAGNNVNILWI